MNENSAIVVMGLNQKQLVCGIVIKGLIDLIPLIALSAIFRQFPYQQRNLVS